MKLSRRDFLKLSSLLPLALLPGADVGSRGYRAPLGTPNILILVFDALSAKNMSLYGYPRPNTPNLSRAAEKGTVFHQHFAGGNFTIPGTASLLTGAYPWSHRAFHMYGETTTAFQTRNIFELFRETHRTFAYSHNPFVNVLLQQFQHGIRDYLGPAGLELFTASLADRSGRDFTALSQAEYLVLWKEDGPASFLLSRLFRTWRLREEARLGREYAEEFPVGVPNSIISYYTLEDAMDWIKTQVTGQGEPFMGYVHLLPPHFPYTPRQDFLGKFTDGWNPSPKPESAFSERRDEVFLGQQRRQYDEFIAYCDAEFGRLYDDLEKAGALDNTILVLTSDHGEMFERGLWAHSNPTLYEPLLRVPLVIWTPGGQAGHITQPTSCTDLLPSLLAAAGMPAPPWVEGQNFFDAVPLRASRAIYSMELSRNAKTAPLAKGSFAIIRDGFKLTRYTGYEGIETFSELYDLNDDPEERANLFPASPAILHSLGEELDDNIAAADHRMAQ